MDHEHDEQWCRPGGYRVPADREVGVLSVGLDRLNGEEQEDPDAGADGGGVGVEDVAFEKRVEAAGEEAEGSGEKEKGYEGAVFGFEAFEEGCQGDGVENKVEDVLM